MISSVFVLLDERSKMNDNLAITCFLSNEIIPGAGGAGADAGTAANAVPGRG